MITAYRRELPLFHLGATVLLASVGAAIVVDLRIALALAGALAAVPLLTSARTRLWFVVLGGVLIFQRSDSLTAPKIAYLALLLVAVLAAWISSAGEDDATEQTFRPVVAAGGALAVLVAASAVVAVANGSTAIAYIRDAAPYYLVAIAPVFAREAARSLTPRTIKTVLGVAGSIALGSFVLQWLYNHSLATPAVTRIALPSFTLCAALFAYALAEALKSRPQTFWLVTACAVPALMLFTGTRSTLVLLVIPPAMLFSQRGLPIRRLGLVAAVLGSAALLLLLVLASGVISTVGAQSVVARLASVPSLVHGASQDQSFQERQVQTHEALQLIRQHPLLGVGPGHLYRWTTPSGVPRQRFSIDSGLAYFAKFGIAGAFTWLLLLLTIWKALCRGRQGVASDALRGFVVFLAAWSVLQAPLEDKGTAFALILLLALVGSERRQEQPT